MKKIFTTLLALSLCALSSVAMSTDDTTTYYYSDYQHSTIFAADSSGSVTENFYNLPDGSGPGDYTGHVGDAYSGLIYMGARWYDPYTRRFLSTDPVAENLNSVISLNRYAYANNNPYTYVDPDGRAVETALDVVSLGLSIAMYNSDPSFINGLGLAYDAVATVIPLLPGAFGIIRSADVVTKGAGKEIGTITTRTTKNKTRLGGGPGEPGVKIKYKDGTEFDMTRSRVKETEINPYKPDRTRNIRFDNGLDKKGIKRAPTKEEFNWFNSIDF